MFLHCRMWLAKKRKQLFHGASASSGRLTNLCRQLLHDELRVRSPRNVNSLTAVRNVEESKPCNGMADASSFAVALLPELQLVSRCATRRGSARNLRAHGCSSLGSPCSSWGSQDPKSSRCHQCTVSFKVQLVICGCASCLSFADISDHLTSVQKRLQSKQRVTSFFLMDRPSFRSCLPSSAASAARV